MNVHLVNPSSVSFGTAVITPRWQYVIVAATPRTFGDPMLVDETLFQMDPDRIQQGGAIGIGIHTANALRGYEIGKMARKRGAYVIFGGIHVTASWAYDNARGNVKWPKLEKCFVSGKRFPTLESMTFCMIGTTHRSIR